MTKSIKIIFLSVFFLSLAFAAYPKDEPSKIFGVCDCQSANNKKIIIELTLNPDNTFHYIDNSDQSRQRIYTGTYIMTNEKIELLATNPEKSFHKKWKVESNGQCIKSKHKLNFRRICLMDIC